MNTHLGETIGLFIDEFHKTFELPDEVDSEMHHPHERDCYMIHHVLDMVQNQGWATRFEEHLDRLYQGSVFTPTTSDVKMLVATIATELDISAEIVLTHV